MLALVSGRVRISVFEPAGGTSPSYRDRLHHRDVIWAQRHMVSHVTGVMGRGRASRAGGPSRQRLRGFVMGRKTGLEAGRASPRQVCLCTVVVWAGSAGPFRVPVAERTARLASAAGERRDELGSAYWWLSTVEAAGR